MLYYAYEMTHATLAPLRTAARAGRDLLDDPFNPAIYTPVGRAAYAALELFETSTRRYSKPEWRLDATSVNGTEVAVKDTVVWSKPFCDLVHFERDSELCRIATGDVPQPRVLMVAPLSGHYATLLRGTVEAFLPGHEVFITDWTDARNVPITQGYFDLNDYIDYLIEMIEYIGPGAHIIGVCQPGPAILSAISLMAQNRNKALPASMSFMGSPIDTRKSPTVPNRLAEERSSQWFEKNVVHSVPWPNPGALRRVYPGFLQLSGFISMNQVSHARAHRNYFNHLIMGDRDSAEKHREFYDEYLSVMDLTAEFYLQSIRDVFQQHKLPKGEFEHRGQLVDPSAIETVALMTVEGEKDDISGIGQTQAAHDLCRNIPENKRVDYVQEGVGHYGVFTGSRFRNEVQPRMAQFILDNFDSKAEPALRTAGEYWNTQ